MHQPSRPGIILIFMFSKNSCISFHYKKFVCWQNGRQGTASDRREYPWMANYLQRMQLFGTSVALTGNIF